MSGGRPRIDTLLALASSLAVHLALASWVVLAPGEVSESASVRAGSAAGSVVEGAASGAPRAEDAARSVDAGWSVTQVRLLQTAPVAASTSQASTTSTSASQSPAAHGSDGSGQGDPAGSAPSRLAQRQVDPPREELPSQVPGPGPGPGAVAARELEPSAGVPSMDASDVVGPGVSGTAHLSDLAPASGGSEGGEARAASGELGQRLGQLLGGVLAAEARRLEEGARRDRQSALLQSRLAAAARDCYPREARRYGVEGAADVAFCLTGGRLRGSAALSRSSGEPSLDAAATGCVLEGALPAMGVEGCFELEVRFVR